MGKVIAFPDMKSRLHHLPAQSGLSQTLAVNGARNNIVLFSGVFVEYHDEFQTTSRADTHCAIDAHPSAAQRSDADWHHRKVGRQDENCGPEKTPQLKHR
ncbi:MAG: hypothetical protein V7703_05750 [Hyphomicrobiales bacterium]